MSDTYLEPDNSKIVNEQTYIPNVQDNFNYVPVLQENIYEFMTNAFDGKGGFRDGSYIVPHSREVFYDSRRDLGFYVNYVQPLVRAMVDPVFNEDVDRVVLSGSTEVTEGMYINGFMENATVSGTELHEYIRAATETARLHGVTFTIVDNYRENELPKSKGDALDNRIYPYVYNRTANQVDSFDVDKFGNIKSIVFTEDSEMVNINGRLEKQKRFSRWTENEYQILTKDDDKSGYKILETYVHGLGVIPVIASYAVRRRNQKNILVDPPLYDIAKVNHAIYNKDSEIRDQERAQGFAQFYVQTDDPGASAVSGTHNIWFLPIDTTIPPGFASPDPAILKGLVENNMVLSETLYKLAGQSGVTGEVKQESGIAKQWDFKAHEAVLKKTISIAEDLEYKIIELFKLYTGEEFEYTVTYPDEFQPNNIAQRIIDLQSLLDMGMPTKTSAMIKKQALKYTIAEDIDEDIMQIAYDEIDEEPENIQQSGVDDDIRKTPERTSADDNREVE